MPVSTVDSVELALQCNIVLGKLDQIMKSIGDLDSLPHDHPGRPPLTRLVQLVSDARSIVLGLKRYL